MSCCGRRPIKLLGFTISIFFEMLYISSLAMFSVSFDCKIIHEHPPYWEVSINNNQMTYQAGCVYILWSLCSVIVSIRLEIDTCHSMQAFPEHQCLKMPTLILLVVGAAMLLLSAAISFLQSLAATELDPDSRDLLALAHARSLFSCSAHTYTCCEQSVTASSVLNLHRCRIEA